MSAKATRKSAVSEEKDKKQADCPVKDVKKKILSVTVEKQIEKTTDKTAEKTEKPNSTDKSDKSAEKVDKGADKGTDKKVENNVGISDRTEKKTESKQVEKKIESKPVEKKAESKPVEKKAESKPVEKKAETKQVEKKDASERKEDKGEKSGKPEKEKKEKDKPKQNGSHNGFGDEGTNGNGGSTVSSEDEVMLVIDDQPEDDMFPELTYEDSDAEGFEPRTPDSRSYTRRSQSPQFSDEVFPELTYEVSDSESELMYVKSDSDSNSDDFKGFKPPTPESSHIWQVKVTRTPETPRPASDKQDKDNNADDSKVLKLKEDAPATTDRKLRSADSPKPESKKPESPKKQEKGQEEKESQEKVAEKENGEKDKVEIEVIVEVETEEEPRSKTDTNYSKSRVKVSPYRRSTRLADQTTSSVMANYTGNNTTMEMDITETSIQSPSASLDDSSYLGAIRSMRGRRSYKKLGELSFKHTARSTPTASTSVTEHTSRPTGTVVGRKRKPEADDMDLLAEVGVEARETSSSHELHGREHVHALGAHGHTYAASKRMRLLERIAQPFRRTVIPTPMPARRAAEIVGINTDLPLSAPVASADVFDPESLKPAPLTPPPEISPEVEREKRCILM